MSAVETVDSQAGAQQELPFAMVYGQAVLEMPLDLYIPPDALEVFLEAFDAPLGQPLTLDAMASLPPDEWPGLKVQLAPTVQQLLCRFNTVAIWRASKDQSEFPGSQALEAVQICLVWRHRQICHYRSMDSAQICALAGMVTTGWSFSELCAQLLVTYGEGAPLQAVTWLKQWVQDGLLERRAP